MEFSDIKRIFADEAAKREIEEYELYYSSETSVSTETLKDEISAFASGTARGICFRCKVDGKIGYAATELFEEDELRSLVLRAAENARFIDKADGVIFEGSPKYEELPKRDYTALSAAELKKIALDIQKKIYEADERVTDGTQSYAATMFGETRLFNSHGLDLCCASGTNVVYANPVMKDGEESQSDFESAAYNADTDLSELVKKSVDKTISKFCAKNVASGKYNVVLSAKQMKALLSVYSSAFFAKQAQSGLSVLAGKEGEHIASEIITVTDDPMREGNPCITNFDAEGVAAYKKTVVDRGILKTLLYNLETAKKAGVESTGNASKAGYASPIGTSPYSFCVEPGDKTLDELFELADKGLYITELKGLHAGANPVTGDFSLESAGFVIENGKIGHAVKNFTLAGNFFELLKAVRALSDKVEMGVPTGTTAFGAPAALVENMSVAGE